MALVRCCLEAEAPEIFGSLIQKCTDPGCKYITRSFTFTKSSSFEMNMSLIYISDTE